MFAEFRRPLSHLVPVLFPFFRHAIANVRLAVVHALHNFLSVPNFPDDWITPPTLRLLFQNLVVEERSDVRDLTLRAWRTAVLRLTANEARLLDTLGPLIREWFEVVMTPLGTPIDGRLLFHHSRVGAEHGYNVDKNMLAQDLSLVSTETILRARVIASQALAIVLSLWPVEVLSACLLHIFIC
jgi:TATA-binding protein-associated factor